MTISFEQAREAVTKLVKQFQVNRAAYLAPSYNEGQARQQLIDPLFIVLGWDVHNEQGAAPNYLQVEVETRQSAGGRKRAPDYVFQFGRRDPKFFVEAKKPGVSIKSDPAPSYQLRAYGWNARLPLSILTDFEEFATYNCRTKPRPTDKASSARLQYYTCEQYADAWRAIWDVFSLEAVRGGSFDQFVQSAKSTRGGATVDADFLETIEAWRRQLAQNIELRNSLSADDLTDAVQRTIDRIIFLRIAEDRDVEPPDQLQELARDDGVYKRLVRLLKRADGQYNSG